MYTRYKFTSVHTQGHLVHTPVPLLIRRWHTLSLSSVHTLQVYVSTYPEAHLVPLLYLVYTRSKFTSVRTWWHTLSLFSVHMLQVYISTYPEAHPVPLLYLVYTRYKFTSVHTRRHTLFHYSI